jgi:hypothetical protein
MTQFRPLALFCLAGLNLGQPVGASPLPTEIQAAAILLEQAWKLDPRTSSTAFPSITNVPEASRPQQVCPQALNSALETLALYCPDQGRLLIDGQRLENLARRFGSWDAAVWLATALGQAITASSSQPSGKHGNVRANLHSYCLGGILLGQAPGLRPSGARSHLAAAFFAFPSRLNGQQGTPAQRSYALLTGLGGTASDCGTAAIANLAAGLVPDPELLRELDSDRSSSAGAIDDVINALCRPKPPLGCPRRLPQAARVRSNP